MQFVLGEIQVVEDTDAVFNLFGAAGSAKRGRNRLLAEDPGDGHLGEGLTAGAGVVVELADFVEGFCVEAIFERVARASGAGVCGDAVQVFIREHAAVEDGEGDAADAFLAQCVEEAIVFGLSGKQIVFGLMDQAGRTQVAQDLRGLSGFIRGG